MSANLLPQKLNRVWHAANKMPRNPTLEQRIEWHLEHAKYCSCRKMLAEMEVLIAKRKQK
jgi:hypothetical protein